MCSSFRPGTSAGYDDITMSVVKDTIDFTIIPLTYIINLSLANGVVPDHLKIARVIPLFKLDTISLLTNYRPVSVLPAISKILERAVYKRLMSFLNTYSVLRSCQYSFRKKHSTAYALIQSYDKLDQSNVTLGLFIHLSKPFNTVNHEIFLSKHEFYGIRGIALQRFN